MKIEINNLLNELMSNNDIKVYNIDSNSCDIVYMNDKNLAFILETVGHMLSICNYSYSVSVSKFHRAKSHFIPKRDVSFLP